MLSRVITSSHNPPWNWKLLNGHIGLGWSLYLTAASAEHFLSNTVCSGQDTTFAKELMGKRCTPSYYGTHARLARLHRTLGQAETYLLENCQRRCRKTRHLLIHLSSCLGEKMWVMDGARKKRGCSRFSSFIASSPEEMDSKMFFLKHSQECGHRSIGLWRGQLQRAPWIQPSFSCIGYEYKMKAGGIIRTGKYKTSV